MKYVVIPLEDVDHQYVEGAPEGYATLDEVKAAIRRHYARTGVIPDVLVGSTKVMIYTNDEISQWGLKQ